MTSRHTAIPPQSKVEALLRDDAYPPGDAGRIEVIETHMSWVFLTRRHAYKLKKPVDLGFLDFTTREKRVADCAEEVRLNARLCPDVYLGVVDVVERAGGHFVGGAGRPVEPAVWMRRLPGRGMLPALLDRDAVEPELLRRIARLLAEFHATAATGPGVDEYGSLETVRANWEENFAQTVAVPERALPPS